MELPVSVNARVRVQVNDGVNSATAMSQAFRVDRKPPSVLILKPTARLRVWGAYNNPHCY